MLLEDGFFHADLHPGNLFIESTTRIRLIDIGMVGIGMILSRHAGEAFGRPVEITFGGRSVGREKRWPVRWPIWHPQPPSPDWSGGLKR
jgi:hypothetical protein